MASIVNNEAKSSDKASKVDDIVDVVDVDGNGKVIVITGVSSGIGNALVHSFIKKGCIVLGCARRQKIIDELNKQYPNKSNTNIPYFTSVDITDNKAVKLWAKNISNNFPIINMVINNAGMGHSANLNELLDTQQCGNVINLNILGTFYICQSFLPLLKKNVPLKIPSILLNISSSAGRNPFPMMSMYSASKYAIEGLTISIANELSLLKLNEYCITLTMDPGPIATRMGITAGNKIATPNNLKSIGFMSLTKWTQEYTQVILNLFNNVKKHNGTKMITQEYDYLQIITKFGMLASGCSGSNNDGSNDCNNDGNNDIVA